MRVNKDKIYVIPSSSKYFNNTKVDSYMENDFTLQVRCKVNYDLLNPNEESLSYQEMVNIRVYRFLDMKMVIYSSISHIGFGKVVPKRL